MARFGAKSKKRLATVDPRLQAVLNVVIKDYDFTVLEGRRSSERQAELYAQGRPSSGKTGNGFVSLPPGCCRKHPYRG
jgi:hypothetical protein